MKVKKLLDYEDQMKLNRGWKRGELCKRLGISQAKWRRHVEGRDPEAEVEDRTLFLAMSALWAELEPWGDVAFTKLEHTSLDASATARARRSHVVHFTTWPA